MLGELQYLLAGIHTSAVQKQIAWTNQLNIILKSENEKDKESIRIHTRARDDFAALAALALALEGAIDTVDSAINSMNERILELANRDLVLQAIEQGDRAIQEPRFPRCP